MACTGGRLVQVMQIVIHMCGAEQVEVEVPVELQANRRYLVI